MHILANFVPIGMKSVDHIFHMPVKVLSISRCQIIVINDTTFLMDCSSTESRHNTNTSKTPLGVSNAGSRKKLTLHIIPITPNIFLIFFLQDASTMSTIVYVNQAQ